MKFLRLIEIIPCDKRLHFIVGVVFMSILLQALLIFIQVYSIVLILSVIGLISFAWGIEFYQKATKSGKYENWDAVAVVIGGVFVLLPYVVRG